MHSSRCTMTRSFYCHMASSSLGFEWHKLRYCLQCLKGCTAKERSDLLFFQLTENICCLDWCGVGSCVHEWNPRNLPLIDSIGNISIISRRNLFACLFIKCYKQTLQSTRKRVHFNFSGSRNQLERIFNDCINDISKRVLVSPFLVQLQHVQYCVKQGDSSLYKKFRRNRFPSTPTLPAFQTS